MNKLHMESIREWDIYEYIYVWICHSVDASAHEANFL